MDELQVTLALMACFVCAIFCAVTVRKVRLTALDIWAAHARAKPIGEIRDDLNLCLERMHAAEQSLKRLHSRAGMRELRERKSARSGTDEEPDWRTDPTGFRLFHEQRLRQKNAEQVHRAGDE